MKKLICLLLSLVLMLQLTFLVNAENSTLVNCDKIIEALQANEYIKTQIGLDNVDFSKFNYSKPIHSYNFEIDGIKESSLFIPLLIDGKLRAFAVEDNGTYHISSELAKIIEPIMNDSMRISIIFDKDSSFLFDGTNLVRLISSNIDLTDRVELTSVEQIIDNKDIVLNSIDDERPLGYFSTINPRIPIYYQCNVSYVPQNNYDICWAASIACIVNYKNNLNLTAVQVAQNFYGYNFDQGIYIGDEQTILRSYGLNYTTLRVFATDNEILSNIMNDNPVYATCSYRNSIDDHDVVIYGINISSPYLYVMDPNFGSTVAYYDSSQRNYYYYNSNAGLRYTFKYSTCVYWNH